MSNLSYRVSLALLALAACSTAEQNTESATAGESTSTSGQTSTGPVGQTTEDTTTDPTTPTTTTLGETSGGGTTESPGTTGGDTGEATTVASTGPGTSTGPVGPTCDDGEKNGDETDTDCGGGTCNPCADGLACLVDTDCEIMSCVDNTCGLPPPNCEDGQLNADETDVDCGGSCPACADDQMCLAPEDCQSQNCKEGTCAPAACDDTIKNGSETDVDCGGFDCQACEEGQTCNADGDCLTLSCEGGVCVAPTCEDMKLNQDETDVDCGGASCPKCADGLACALPADCESGVCDEQMKLCAAASCSDGVKNGMETDVDCGGPDCKPCSIPGLVINEVDYDQVGTDNAEFIEILNNTAAPIDLAGHRLLLVNGSNNTPYLNVDLAPAGILQPGQYLVLAAAAVVVPPEAKKINFGKANDNIENGAPDGIALVNTLQLKLVDALSYEGSMTMVPVPGLGNVSLVEGMALPANFADSNVDPASFARLPNGYDGNNAATDWALSKTPTPGLANVP